MQPRPPRSPNTFGKTLIIQPLPGIGDMVWHLPHIDAIATASGTISLLTKARALSDQLFADDPRVERILPLCRGVDGRRHDGVFGFRRLAGDLREHGFDTVWIFHGSSRYAIATALAGIPERIGFGIGWQNMFLTTQFPLTRRDWSLHPSEKATRLLQQHGLPVDPVPRYHPPASARQAIAADYAALPRPWVGLGIGSSEVFKQWGADRFTALAGAVLAEMGGTVLLLGGPGEASMAAAIDETDGRIVPVIGRALGEVAALTQACDVVVSNDTGLMNLAAACGAVTVGLFGGSPPIDHFYPTLSAVVPVGGARYKLDRMAEIPVGRVLDEVRDRLSAPVARCTIGPVR